VVCEITGAEKVDLVGLCLGGTMTMMTATHLDELGDDQLNTLTLLNTMVDFSDPGPLGRFTDEATVAKLEKKMAQKGYLEGGEMAAAFDLLRPNDLIFNYVVSNWLLGQQPPAFDILAGTRTPPACRRRCTRSICVTATSRTSSPGEMELARQQLDLKDIDQDLYIVAAINDHIVLWTSSYATIHHVSGHARFVLSSGGHIAGIVNPPSPRAWYEVAEDNPRTLSIGGPPRSASRARGGKTGRNWGRSGPVR
jgi:poly[(R)-3-hydroxyalkanoate] polymerase subunit PhaC